MESQMERVLSMGGRLKKLLEDAEAEAYKITSEARAHADQMINEARQEGDYRLSQAQRRTGIDDLIEAEEKKAQKEAQNVLEEYKTKVSTLKETSSKNHEAAVNFVLKEVLPK
jgi:vacuolar-type H+-ATPase subunit H